MNTEREARENFRILQGCVFTPCAVKKGTCEGSCPVSHARVLRGASWINNDESNTRSSNRNNNEPMNRNNNIGFRCVLVVVGGKAYQPNNRRDRRPGQKPRLRGAKNSLTWMASPWVKRTHGWGLAAASAGAGNPRG
jgi:hypothetical protein